MTKLEIAPIPDPIPVLMGGTGQRTFNSMKVGLIKINSQDPVKFNQSELTLISKMMLLIDTALKEEKAELTELREKLWAVCDKEDITTASEFKTLNRIKTDIRKLRKLRQTIVSINQKVKKQTKQLQ
jgi:hypothetical protein